MKLVIFDRDQTLVDVLHVHNKALAKVFQEFFQVNAKLNDIDFAGKSLIQIFQELAALKNTHRIRSKTTVRNCWKATSSILSRIFQPARHVIFSREHRTS
jgi:phosphoglycolate phosphatase-like HAD superfamily hydrolase